MIQICDAPNLKNLHLQWATVRWEEAKFPHLTCLTLTNIHPNVLPPVADLVHILVLFSTLRIFRLERINRNRVPLVLPSTTENLVLPNLEVLGLMWVEAPIFLHLLTRIIASNLHSLSFGSIAFLEFDGEAALATLSRGDPARSLVLNTLLKNDEDTVRLTVRWGYLEMVYGPSGATIQFPKTRALYHVDDIINAAHIDLIQSPLDLCIETHWEDNDLNDTPYTNSCFLDRLPTLTRLEDTYVSRTYLLEYLSEPRADGQSPCPLLNEIRLNPEPGTIGGEYFCYILRAVQKLISNRPEVRVYDGDGILFRDGLAKFMGMDVPSEEDCRAVFGED